MKAASSNEIKQELSALSPKKLTELCLRLARFKKENKELLTYLLFEAHNEDDYVVSVKNEIDEQFEIINKSQLYFAKKSLRKILRIINKYCRYSAVKETEIELRLYFCVSLQKSGIEYKRNSVINNLYLSQLKKIQGLIDIIEEDLQFDYLKQLQRLS